MAMENPVELLQMIVLVREVISVQHPALLEVSSAGSSSKCVEEGELEHKPLGTVVSCLGDDLWTS